MAESYNNTTRQNIHLDPANPVDHLNAGYEGEPSTDFFIPSCGIADADGALKNLFVNDIGFATKSHQAGATQSMALKKPVIIFATGERWALAKKLHPPRDTNKALMLPAISIRRTSFTQTADDITGRGINQHTGFLTIKRRLSEEFDRDYQNLVNNLGLKNLTNMPGTSRETGAFKNYAETKQGGLLDSSLNLKNNSNVWEILTIPQPQFFTTTYEVVFWTQYTTQMNELIEKFVTSFLPQERAFRLKTDKGYWFMAYVEDTFQGTENFDDFKEAERVIRYTITMKVKGYILAGNGTTDMVPVRRWVSSPNISFDVSDASSLVDLHSRKSLEKATTPQETGGSPFDLTDINQVDSSADAQNKTYNEKLATRKIYTDPDSGQSKSKYVAVLDSNQKQGETVYKASSPAELERFLNK